MWEGIRLIVADRTEKHLYEHLYRNKVIEIAKSIAPKSMRKRSREKKKIYLR